MGPKSRFDCQDRDENRVSTQIFDLLINQRRQILRSNAVFKPAPAFFTAWGVFCLPRLTGLGRLPTSHNSAATCEHCYVQ